MITGIDHVVILVSDLGIAIDQASDAGFIVTGGGKHDEGETHNALIPFSDGSYIELLAYTASVPPDHYFARRFALGYGLADLALRTTDIDLAVSAITERGLPYPLPTHLGRHVPDGRLASWRMSLPATLHPTAALPFLIQDLTDRSIRVPNSPAATSHPNGALGLAGATMVVKDVVEAERQVRCVLAPPPSTSTEHFPAGRGLRQLEIGNSDQWLALIQPLTDTPPMRHLQAFGNSLYAVAIRTRPTGDMLPGEGILLPVEQFSGARLYLQD